MSALALLGWGLACDRSPTDPMPAEAVPYEAPSEYTGYWAEVESCSGLTGDLSQVAWYRVDAPAVVINGVEYDGYWFADGNRIVLGPGGYSSVGVIEHEMLHALLHRGDHPCRYFVELCGRFVQQPDSCT